MKNLLVQGVLFIGFITSCLLSMFSQWHVIDKADAFKQSMNYTDYSIEMADMMILTHANYVSLPLLLISIVCLGIFAVMMYQESRN